MFSLCLTKIRRKRKQQKINCEVGASYAADKTIEEKIAISEETEETRNKQKDIIQKHTTKNPTDTSSANKTAIAVATPLPPLKLRYIG